MAEALALWEHNATGPLSLGPAGQFGWLRVPEPQSFFSSFGIPDPSAGPTSAHFELIAQVRLFIDIQLSSSARGLRSAQSAYILKTPPLPREGHFLSFISAVISPTSSESFIRQHVPLSVTDVSQKEEL